VVQIYITEYWWGSQEEEGEAEKRAWRQGDFGQGEEDQIRCTRLEFDGHYAKAQQGCAGKTLYHY
jgi:hypothetical protein